MADLVTATDLEGPGRNRRLEHKAGASRPSRAGGLL